MKPLVRSLQAKLAPRKRAAGERSKSTRGMSQAYTFRASDSEPDRDGDRIAVSGWKLAAYAANPLVLYNHDAGDGGFLGLGSKKTLPIGRGRAYVQGNALMVDVEFDLDDPFAAHVESKVRGGSLNAVSVRFLALKYVENELGGFDISEADLMEISVVTIPANPRAVVTRRPAEKALGTKKPTKTAATINKATAEDIADKVLAHLKAARRRG